MDRDKRMDKTNALVRRILTRFHETADDSLIGPNSAALVPHFYSASIPKNSLNLRRLGQDELPRARKVNSPAVEECKEWQIPKLECISRPGFGQHPLLMTGDRSCGLLQETNLEGHTIACFDIGGEKRLCLPQILNRILHPFSLARINAAFEELRIFSSLCGTNQLEELKIHNILPKNAVGCGLITKTNAARLCGHLLRPQKNSSLSKTQELVAGLRVKHKCFGKCQGIFMPGKYTTPTSAAIRCSICWGMFAPRAFVMHSHGASENRICHWGFDSANWRNYLLLSDNQVVTDALKKEFEDVKRRFTGSEKQSQNTVEEKDEKKIWSSLSSSSSSSGISSETFSDNNDAQRKTSSCSDDNEYTVLQSLTSGSRVQRGLQAGDESIVSRDDLTFAERVSVACRENQKQRQLLRDDVYDRPTKRRRTEYDSESEFIDSPGHSEDDVLVSKMRIELMQLFEREAQLFHSVTDNRAALSKETRKQFYNDYIQFYRHHLTIVNRLLDARQKLKKELFDLQLNTTNAANESLTMNRNHKSTLQQLRGEFQSSVARSDEENGRLRNKVESLMNARKRSDLGLVKAKYKAQVELFRQKCLTLEHSNRELLPKCAELRKILNRCYSASGVLMQESSLPDEEINK